MPKISPIYNQHRQAIGNHTMRLDRKQGGQELQNERVKKTAMQPGRHKKNIDRQNVAHAALQLLSVLSSMRNSNITPAISSKRADELSMKERITHVDERYKPHGAEQVIHQETGKNKKQNTREKENGDPRSGVWPSGDTKKYPGYNIDTSLQPQNRNIPLPESGLTTLTNHIDSKIATMLNSISNVIHEAGQFISRNDPLRFPAADALSAIGNHRAGNTRALSRLPRYVVFFPKTTTPPPVPDDVKIVKLYDYSCMNNGENLGFSQILRHVGKSLQDPFTMMAIEIKKIYNWNKGFSCPEPDEISKITRITKMVNVIASQLVALLPGSQALAITQYIIGPLLERAANDLEGKPTSPEQEFSLIQQVTQQARFSIMTTNHREQMHLKTPPISIRKEPRVDLPIFHIKDGVNHINLENNGKVYSVPVSERNGKIFAFVPKGTESGGKRHQVYFNHLAQKWERTGDGKFNRFSKREQRIVHKYSLGTYHRYQPKMTDRTAVYSVINPFSSRPKRLSAVEILGRLVPYRYDFTTGKSFIYDPLVGGHAHEIVLAQNEWHLKIQPSKKIRFESLYCPEYGRNLNVAVVRKVKGREILAQVNPNTGIFWGKKFFRDEVGNLKSVSSKLKNKELRQKPTKGDNSPGYKIVESSVGASNTIPLLGDKYPFILKENVGGSYIKYSTSFPEGSKNVESLVVSAHGGFIDSDTSTPVVSLPSDMVIKMLTPHGTKLFDPGLDNVVNAGEKLRAYVTFKRGKVTDVDFIPQDNNSEWKYSGDYSPSDILNTQGRKDGLQNYRHYRYEGESDEHIANVLMKNRALAKKGEADLTDVLTVNDKFSDIGDTSLSEASLQKIIDLDREGKLINANGDRYKSIIFSHCRNHFLRSESSISTYSIEKIENPQTQGLPKGATMSEITITRLHRAAVDKPFEKEILSMGYFAFIPVNRVDDKKRGSKAWLAGVKNAIDLSAIPPMPQQFSRSHWPGKQR